MPETIDGPGSQPPAGLSVAPVATPTPTATAAASTEFLIDDVFEISGRGPVAMGTLIAGRVEVGDSLILVGSDPLVTVHVEGVEAIRKPGAAAAQTEDMGLLLGLPPGVGSELLVRGAVLARP